MKSERNSKLGYPFKRAVATDRTDLTVRRRRRIPGISPAHVYYITMIVGQQAIKVGGDEIGVGDVRVPGFANAPES